MNHTLKHRSALIRAAEAGLRRERIRSQSAAIFAVSTFVIVAFLIGAFIQQVLA